MELQLNQYTLGYEAGYETVLYDRTQGKFYPLTHYRNELEDWDDYDKGFLDGVRELFE